MESLMNAIMHSTSSMSHERNYAFQK